MVKRLVNPIKSRSFFLFGPRGVGKSFFLKNQFIKGKVLQIDLLMPEFENAYSLDPNRLILELAALHAKNRPEWIYIDEIQKIPKLLDVVHYLIEKEKYKFILTGSSARKLKRGAANLLAGRANIYSLFPFSYVETSNKFDLNMALHWGQMPSLLNLKTNREKMAYLNSYTLTYLNEEIKTEQLIRNLDPFRSFLPILGQMSGKIINHKKIAVEIGVDSKTVKNYFQIIEETLLGFYLPSFHESVRKSQKANPKFYLVDCGIKKSLEGSLEQKPVPKTSVFRELFEHFIINEIKKLNEYYENGYRLSYYLTKNGAKIDLILSKLQKNILIEIKSSDKIDLAEVKSFSERAKDFRNVKGVYYISRDPKAVKYENVNCVSWTYFLENFKKI